MKHCCSTRCVAMQRCLLAETKYRRSGASLRRLKKRGPNYRRPSSPTMPLVANQPRGMNCSESAAILRNGPSVKLFGEWRSSDEVCKIRRGEPLYVSNAKIPKNVVNRRDRFLTNDVAKATFKSVLKCQPRECG